MLKIKTVLMTLRDYKLPTLEIQDYSSKETRYIFQAQVVKLALVLKINDVFSDIFLIPAHTVQMSEKYKDVMAELEKNPDVTRLVGHSLGSSVLQEINNRNNQKYITTTYNAPFISFGNRQKNPDALRFSNKGDLISALDRNAIKVETGTINPSEAHKFKNMTTQGSFEQGVDDSAQVARNIQIQNWNE